MAKLQRYNIKEEAGNLYQCPHSKYAQCDMIHQCLGCENFTAEPIESPKVDFLDEATAFANAKHDGYPAFPKSKRQGKDWVLSKDGYLAGAQLNHPHPEQNQITAIMYDGDGSQAVVSFNKKFDSNEMGTEKLIKYLKESNLT